MSGGDCEGGKSWSREWIESEGVEWVVYAIAQVARVIYI